MTAAANWTTKISNYLDRINVTESLSDEDFDFEFDEDFAPEFEDEWDVMDVYEPTIPLPTE